MNRPTATKAADPATRLMRAIYACRRKVDGLKEDAAWRDFLKATIGKEHLSDMTGGEMGRVLDKLHERGAPRAKGSAKHRPLASDPLAKKIRALWLSLNALGELQDSSEAALAAFIYRQTNVEALQWLKPSDLALVVEALRGWCSRAGFSPPANAPTKQCNADLVRAQWAKLIALGAFQYGIFAGLDTWMLKNFGVTAPQFLEPPDQLRAIDMLGRWVRRRKAQVAPYDATKEEALS